MVTAFVGLGSNLSAPREQIERALRALDALPAIHLAARSHLYRSAPWGGIEQPDFVNAAAKLDTELSAMQLIQTLLGIEHDFGRRRDGMRYGPRLLDLDLLLYADQHIDEPGLHVPHPRLHERAFVLMPLAEIAPGLEVPGQGRIEALLARVDTSSCSMLAVLES